MAKDYAKFVPPKTHSDKKNFGWVKFIVILLAVIVLALATLLYIYTKKNAHDNVVALNTTVKTAPRAPVEPLITFDFYDELTNAKPVTLNQPPVEPPAPPKAIAVTVTKPSVPEKLDPIKKESIFNDDEVTKLLAAENTGGKYIIQLGAFETQSGAKRLQLVLEDAGFNAEIITINKDNKTLYRVQQGPFASLEVAKSTQERMQKRGIISVIRQSV